MQMAILMIFLLLSSICLIIFMTLSSDIKFVLPVAVIASILGVIIFGPSNGLVPAMGIFLVIILTALLLLPKLKSYITFEASTILNPSIKRLTFFIIICSALSFYL